MTFNHNPLSELKPIIPVRGYTFTDNISKEQIFARFSIQDGKVCTMKHSSESLKAAGIELGSQVSWYEASSKKGKVQEFIVCKFSSDELALRTTITENSSKSYRFGSTSLMRSILDGILDNSVDVTKINLKKDFKSASIEIPLDLCQWGNDTDSIPYVAIDKEYVRESLRKLYRFKSDGSLDNFVGTNI